ncbi:DNA methyltransferase [Flavobacterium branchiophilum]|uniref:site-specific DNA-methyltransferase (adenine-specific) n=1 Tax=Flavobacterium branchiophilum TaxID=55197 RepID=A0A2H3KJ05_9FLAO|nr:site-specific DNA-methyltransferase [Flavobacterium branchiophilum]PDS21981.1 restriction endonuclease subunit M [Flavobacterium branchiophilum]
MKLYSTLESLLKTENDFIDDDGHLKKWVIINKAQNYDADLIGLLLENEVIKSHFFISVKDVLVFNQSLFIQFLEQKNYLKDSYTSFRNKIGLTIDGKFLNQRNEVALVWPYKDCILEGGQSREEDKRKEIFFNEILAQDEINQLLEPKVLTNAKRFTVDGEKTVNTFNRNSEGTITDNLIIKGNNLLALHTIKEEFAGKVKLIYIDPPFNTGNDSFKYNDSFNHSTWLTFMRNRLRVAKELLREDGVIFINIDAIEEAYLKVICDEIFDMQNFVNVIAVKSSTPSGTKTAHKEKTIIKQKDLILCYKKSNQLRLNPQFVKRDKWDTHYSLILNKDKNGKNTLSKLIDLLVEKGICKEGSKLDEINIDNKVFKKFYLENSNIICRLQSHKNIKAEKISREKNNEVYEHFEDNIPKGLYYNGQVITPLLQGIKKVYSNQSFTEDLGILACDFWSDIDFQNTQNEGDVSFPTAKKPEVLIHRIIEMSTKENDIVLDYHLGSGTTAAVAHKMNRQYIGVEQMDYIETVAVERLKKVIEGEQGGISKAVNWQGRGEFVYLELKKHNQDFIEKIETAKDTKTILEIWEDMKTKSFLTYNVAIKKQDEHIEDFKKLPLEEQKQHLVSLLDKNQLYVNRSNIN